MIIRIVLAVAFLAAGPAHAVRRLSAAESMAYRSAGVIGAAAGCGIPQDRLSAVKRTIMQLVRKLAQSPTELEHAHSRYELRVRLSAEWVSSGRRECPAAIRAFERVERKR
jgi:hypothetical protein